MNLKQQRKEFADWMSKQLSNHNKPYKSGTINAYATAIATAPSRLIGLKEEIPSLYSIKDSTEFDRVRKVIYAAPNYKEVNIAAGNQAFYHGMEKYSEFLKEQETGISKNRTIINPPISPKPDIPKIPNLQPKQNLGDNLILYGPPGTGKTYNTTAYAVAKIEGVPYSEIAHQIQKYSYEAIRNRFEYFTSTGQIMFTTFHQSYSYEEFIEGIKPVMQDTEETLTYELKKGLFQEFCDQARKHSDQHYVFIIDEINRGNISKIFGELITLIEPSKRLGQREEITLQLPYSQNTFGVPSNVTILATMNTADRSIARLDSALRRRFQFIELLPNPALLESIELEQIDFKALLHKINTRIEALYDRERTIGHAYFMPLLQDPTMERLADLFKNAIIPLLQEYFYEDYEMIQLILGDYGKDTALQFIKERSIHPIDLFGTTLPTHMEEKTLYEINDAAFLHPAAYRSIYE
ncbi:AAA family ATPase [Sporosarcina sp. PTS2304]|uniref:McrB family protein n=1 Tax=Sporosarcina sp. PTS2304 TaxID=2283194 RepID=UPI000E0D854D|nr:AAA family ATPase [Sporosarcina sp. PTS2304]AXI00972.1 AAA family ATPase [Sporosarcina sp. PTS2304]